MIYYPEVTWSGGDHTLTAGTPLDNPQAVPFSSEVTSRVPGTGEQDTWTDGHFPRAKFSFRYIPVSGSAADSGWHFPDPGFYAWYQHARQNIDNFTLKPDKDSGGAHTCRLISWTESKERSGRHYRVDIEVEDVNGNVFNEY